MSLGKMVKEKDDLRDLNPQLKCCINDLRAPMCGLKKSLASWDHKAEIAANKMQTRILQGLSYTASRTLASQGIYD